MLNIGLLKHPLNWATVWLMWAIAICFLHYALTYVSINPPAPATKDDSQNG